MTGKQLKEWANRVPDDAVIEYSHYGWESVDPSKLRAVISPLAENPLPIEDDRV